MLKRTLAAAMVLCLLICCAPEKIALADSTEKDISAVLTKTEKISDTEMRMYVQHDDMTVFCKVFLPEGQKKCPALIMAGGLRGPFSMYTDMAREMSKNGIAGIIFDFCGSVSPSKSSGSMTDMSIETEISDLLAVLDAVRGLPRVDADCVYLGGHSFGGLVAATASTKRPDDVKGLLLVEPSFQMPDEIRNLLPEGSEIPKVMYTPIFCGADFLRTLRDMDAYAPLPDYPGKTVIFAGTVSPAIGADQPQYLDRAAETFPDAELIFIPEADHGFTGDVRAVLIEQMKDFILEIQSAIPETAA